MWNARRWINLTMYFWLRNRRALWLLILYQEIFWWKKVHRRLFSKWNLTQWNSSQILRKPKTKPSKVYLLRNEHKRKYRSGWGKRTIREFKSQTASIIGQVVKAGKAKEEQWLVATGQIQRARANPWCFCCSSNHPFLPGLPNFKYAQKSALTRNKIFIGR